MSRHRLRDATWASLHAKLRTIPGIWKTDVAALRRFVEAVAYVPRTGTAWEDLPAAFGEPGTAYRRFRRWACKGIWDELFLEGVPTDALETVMLDSSACKAQRFAGLSIGSGTGLWRGFGADWRSFRRPGRAGRAADRPCRARTSAA